MIDWLMTHHLVLGGLFILLVSGILFLTKERAKSLRLAVVGAIFVLIGPFMNI